MNEQLSIKELNSRSNKELFELLEEFKSKKIESFDKEQLLENKKNIKRIKNILIERNLYIAEIIAKKYINKGIDYDDLFQVASLGLILSLDRFDVKMGYEFSSFATPTIVGEVKRYFRDKGWVIKVPRRIQELSKSINTATLELSQQLQKSPSIEQLSEYLSVSSEEIIEALEASQVYSPQSLDKKIEGDENELNIGDILGENDKSYESFEIMDFINKTMETFSEIEKKIIIYRYFEKMTQTSIAQELQVSQMTVSRMEKKILKKFKNELNID